MTVSSPAITISPWARTSLAVAMPTGEAADVMNQTRGSEWAGKWDDESLEGVGVGVIVFRKSCYPMEDERSDNTIYFFLFCETSERHFSISTWLDPSLGTLT